MRLPGKHFSFNKAPKIIKLLKMGPRDLQEDLEETYVRSSWCSGGLHWLMLALLGTMLAHLGALGRHLVARILYLYVRFIRDKRIFTCGLGGFCILRSPGAFFAKRIPKGNKRDPNRPPRGPRGGLCWLILVLQETSLGSFRDFCAPCWPILALLGTILSLQI